MTDRHDLLRELSNDITLTSPDDNSEIKYLKLKCFHYEKSISELETERSKLSVRATLAETQFEKF